MPTDVHYEEYTTSSGTSSTTSSKLGPWLLSSGLLALLLRKKDTREHLGAAAVSAVDGTRELLVDTTSRTGNVAKSAASQAQHGLTSGVQAATRAVRPLKAAAERSASSLASTRESLMRDVGQVTNEALQDSSRQARRARLHAEREEKTMANLNRQIAAEVAKQMARQEKQLRELDARVVTLTARHGKQRGGLPWGLILLSAGGYYLYRNEGARQKLMDLVQNLNPGPKGNFERAGNALRSGVEALKNGESPSKALGSAVGEVQSGVTKTARNASDEVQDRIQDAKQGAQDSATELKERAGQPQSGSATSKPGR